MFEFKQAVRPKEGWQWPVHGRTFSAETLQDLLDQVTRYRAQVLLPPGQPLEEFRVYALKKWPEIFDRTRTVPAFRRQALTEAVHDGLLKIKAAPHDPASPEEVKARAKFCEECEFCQDELHSTRAAKAAVGKLEILLGKKHDFGYCALFGSSLSLSLCIKNPSSSVSRSSTKAPKGCPLDPSQRISGSS